MTSTRDNLFLLILVKDRTILTCFFEVTLFRATRLTSKAKSDKNILFSYEYFATGATYVVFRDSNIVEYTMNNIYYNR